MHKLLKKKKDSFHLDALFIYIYLVYMYMNNDYCCVYIFGKDFMLLCSNQREVVRL